MEIRSVLRGEYISFAASAPPRGKTETAAPDLQDSADRVELSRRWIEQMEQQNAQLRALLEQPAGEREGEDEGGLLGYMKTEEEKLDSLSEALDIQMKCLKIAMNIMKGKKVPPQDERYLMEHDPEGYKLAISMRSMEKVDDKECESVLKDEDKNSGETAETEETAPAEGGETE